MEFVGRNIQREMDKALFQNSNLSVVFKVKLGGRRGTGWKEAH